MFAFGVQGDTSNFSNFFVQVQKLLVVHIVLVLLEPQVLALGLRVPVLLAMLLAVLLHVGEVLLSLVLESVVDFAGVADAQGHALERAELGLLG